MPRVGSYPEPDVWPDGEAIDVVELALDDLTNRKGISRSDLAARVHEAAVLARTAYLHLHDTVVEARRGDVAWAEIGRQLNMSRQAAQQRYGRAANGEVV